MGKTKCCFCTNDVGNPHIKCTVCNDIKLCLQCFACGAELGDHSKYHPYQVLSGNPPVVFQPVFSAPSWNADDELKLLDAVEQYGFGNWDDVSKYISSKSGTIKSAAECEEHYTDFYVHGSIGRVTYMTDATVDVRDHTGAAEGPLSPSLSAVLPPLELSEAERRMLGYMPYRDDYERDMDNDSESILAALTPLADDEYELEKATRGSLVNQYRERLRTRLQRRQIARQHGVLKAFVEENAKQIRQLAGLSKSTAAAEVKDGRRKQPGSKDEREFRERMRIFAQFHTPSEHESFFENLRKERLLKLKIKELQRCRRNGIRSKSDCKKFELDRLKREKRKERLKKLLRNNKCAVNGRKVPNGDVAGEDRCNGSVDVQPWTNSQAKCYPRRRGVTHVTARPKQAASKLADGKRKRRRRRRNRTGWS